MRFMRSRGPPMGYDQVELDIDDVIDDLPDDLPDDDIDQSVNW